MYFIKLVIGYIIGGITSTLIVQKEMNAKVKMAYSEGFYEGLDLKHRLNKIFEEER